MLDPHEVTIAFEIATIETLRSSFRNGIIKGCFFSPCRFQSLRSAKEYQENADVRNGLQSLVALAQISNEDIFLGFQKLKESTAKMRIEKIPEFVNYFEATWLGEKCLRGRRIGGSPCLKFGAKF